MGDDMTLEQQWVEYRDAQRLLAETRWTRIIRAAATDSPIEFYSRVKVDDYLTVTIGEWGGYYLQIVPMIYNDRLVMTPFSCIGVYDHGWCYKKGAAPALAAMVWNPQSSGEPLGFIKRIGPKRMAGEHAAGYTDGPKV